MISRSLIVTNKLGIHARPAGMIVDLTAQTKSNVTFIFEGTRANAKSILNVMMLAVPPGASLTIEIDGEDEEEAFSKLEQLFNDNFNEEPA